MFGFTSTDGYDYNKTKAVRNGQFIGKMFDQWYQPDETWGRAVSSIVRYSPAHDQHRSFSHLSVVCNSCLQNEWVEQLRDESFF